MEEEPKLVNQNDKRSVKRNVARFKGEHGIYILFSSEIMDNVARDSKLTVRETKLLLFCYYVSKYIAFSAAIYPDLISTLSKELKFNYSSVEIRKALPRLYDLKYINKYGDVYVINRDTQDWLKMFTNQLTYKLHNFNCLGFYDSLRKKRNVPLYKRKILEKQAKIAKRIQQIKEETNGKYNL